MIEHVIEYKDENFCISKKKNKYTILTTKDITVWGLKKIKINVELPNDIIACIPNNKVNNHKSLFRMIFPGSDFSFYIFSWFPLIIQENSVIADVVFIESRECYVVIDTN